MLSPSLSVFYFFVRCQQICFARFAYIGRKYLSIGNVYTFILGGRLLRIIIAALFLFFNITIFYLQNGLKAILFKGIPPILKLH